MLGAIDDRSGGTLGYASDSSVRERAAEIAVGGDMAAARALLEEQPMARTVLEDELIRAHQYGMVHDLASHGAPQNIAQAQSMLPDVGFSIRAPGGRQFHENEIALIQEQAPRFAQVLSAQTGRHFSAPQAERVLAQVAYARINPGATEPEQPRLERAALDFLASINPRTLLGADPSVPNAQQAFYFSSSPAQRTDSRIYSGTLQSNAEFYASNGLLRDPAGAAKRAEIFEQRMATAESWTFAAPGIATSLVLAPVAPTLINNARYFVLAHPTAAMEGTDLIGGFILGDALPAGASLGPAAATAIAARTEGNFLERGVRALTELFDTPARETAQRIQQSVVRAVDAGDAQRVAELAGGTLNSIGAKGRIGEAVTREFLENQGYEVLGSLVNRSNNGLDVVARAANGRITIIEVKATATGERVTERGLQSEAQAYFDRIFNSASQGTGRYANLADESKPVLTALEDARRAGTQFDYRWSVVYLDSDNRVQGLVMDRWAQATRQ